jgi:ribosomal protein L15
LESDTRKKKRYFGKQGLTSRGTAKDRRKAVNLYDVRQNMFSKEGCKIDLSKYKVLGTGDGFKAEILAKNASKLAVEKMEKAGGKIVLVGKRGSGEDKSKEE